MLTSFSLKTDAQEHILKKNKTSQVVWKPVLGLILQTIFLK